MHKKDEIIEDGERYGRLMAIYALNDCLAVTQLTQTIKIKKSLTTSTTIYENIPDDEQIIKFKNRWIYVHLINLMNVQKFMHQMEFQHHVTIVNHYKMYYLGFMNEMNPMK